MISVFVWAVILVLAVATARADYECLCNHHVELAVYPQPNPNTNTLGQLYENDCKATVPNAPGLVPGWAVIEYEHSVKMVHFKYPLSLYHSERQSLCPNKNESTYLLQ